MRTVEELYSEQSQKIFHRICEQFATHCIPREIYDDDYYRNDLVSGRPENASKPDPDIYSVSCGHDYRKLVDHEHEYRCEESSDQQLLESYKCCKV